MPERIKQHEAGRYLFFLFFVLLLSIVSCAGGRIAPDIPTGAYIPHGDDALIERYAPVLVPEHASAAYNRIGRPKARVDWRGDEFVFVDPAEAVYFADRREFSTSQGIYTNLVYRVHFERVPYRLAPSHVTAGRNPGLLVVITLNGEGKPLLVTTVHTCGCYLTFFPTSYLPPSAYPPSWDLEGQRVWGEEVPGLLRYPETFSASSRLVLFLRDGTHRVMGARVEDEKAIATDYAVMPAMIEPMSALRTIPVEWGGKTSFFEEEGLRAGYVKNSYKPLETLFVSWWSLNLYIGADKDYADGEETGNYFFTSLKPWNRRASDMWPFAEFLRFWGWGL